MEVTASTTIFEPWVLVAQLVSFALWILFIYLIVWFVRKVRTIDKKLDIILGRLDRLDPKEDEATDEDYRRRH